MATIIAEKTAPVGGKTQFRTQTVNGKPQIYFDAIDESTATPKPKRPIRTVTSNRLPEQLRPKPVNQKSSPQSQSSKSTKRSTKVTFNDDQSGVGVYMTMDEISELVKAVKENTQNQNTRTMSEPRAPTPPPIQQQEQPPPPPPPQLYEVPPVPLIQTSPRQEALGMMAEKKRQKWMREKAEMDRMKLEVEYDQLKHQLSPMHQKASSSPERSDYSSANKPPLPPSAKPNDDVYRQRLMEKKQQQWKQENAERAPVWNPFGRPGAGAPNANEIQIQTQLPSNNVMPYRPPESSSAPDQIVLNDQTRVPAAMRTNLLFGDVRFEDAVKNAKEVERRQWLDDLQKQIEDNKRQKFTQQETERRQDFMLENFQPLIHEPSARHPPPMDTSPLPSSQTLTTTHAGQDLNRSSRHDSVVQQTYDKIVEATELAKYEKKAQLIEKLKRNGHKTDLLARTLPDMKNISPVSNQKIHEKSYDPPPKPIATTTKIEPLQLNVGNETQHSYRASEVAKRDEAVNTIDSTFRSEHSVQTDLRMPPHRQMFTFAREESDLPPQVPNHLLKNGKQSAKKVRIRSLEDPQRQRQSQSHSHPHPHPHPSIRDDGAPSQRSGTHGPVDLLHRPLWNYQNPHHREYVPNSRRDPHYEKRHRQLERSSRIEEVPKKTSYNRWNSDGQLQHEQNEKKMTVGNRTRSMGVVKQRDEPIINVFKGPKPRQDTFVITKREDQQNFSNISSLDRYEHFTPYIRTDEVLDPAKAFSPVPQSREQSAYRPPRAATVPYDDNQRRQNVSAQPQPYHVPPARQEHILQQLTAIKENLVRRQQEVASSMNAIPV